MAGAAPRRAPSRPPRTPKPSSSPATPAPSSSTPAPPAGGGRTGVSQTSAKVKDTPLVQGAAAAGAKVDQGVRGDLGKGARRVGGVGKEAAGALIAAVAYAIVINGLRYGTAGVTGWLKAKFLNRPMQGPPAGGAGGGAVGPSTGKPNESPTSGSSGGGGNGVSA